MTKISASSNGIHELPALGPRTAPRPTEAELQNGVPLFLQQLVDTLQREQATTSRQTSPEMTQSAQRHGGDLEQAGFTVGQVVDGYGDVCQAVTALAAGRVQIEVEDECGGLPPGEADDLFRPFEQRATSPCSRRRRPRRPGI